MPTMHEVEYTIVGDDMQFVKIELDPKEAVVAEAGGMMYIEDGIQLDTVFGDGSQQQGGFMGALMGAGKRLLTGESSSSARRTRSCARPRASRSASRSTSASAPGCSAARDSSCSA